MGPASIGIWWGVIYIHYGSIDNFTDATTISNIRRFCIEWCGNDAATIALLEPWPKDRDDWERSYAAHRSRMSFTLAACSAWLKARGLPL